MMDVNIWVEFKCYRDEFEQNVK